MPRLPDFLFVASLAAACGDDGEDEDAVNVFRVEDLEILSVTVAGDEATVMITYGGSHRGRGTVLLKREDGRWLIGAR